MNTLRAALVVVLLIVFTQTLLTQADSTDTFDSDDQNAIKNVVEAYFESRYRAMNTLQLENLDALIAESTEGETDMREELDKLEVEIQHAKLNHLRYREYKYYLDYIDISIDTNTQTATVAVSEGHDVVFEVSIEINGSQPAVSSMRNLEHIIVLKKEDGIWKIVSDYYRDYLWRLIEATGISKEELLQSLIVTPIESLENDFPESITACSLSYDESIHPYTRNGAVAYAHKWATAPRPYNSPPYDDFTALMGDCTNFVSQAIHEGGSAAMVFGGTHGIGQVGWYYYSIYDRATDWNHVNGLKEFIITEYLLWPAGPEGCVVSKDQAYFGDLIQYDWTNDGSWDHSVIIVESIDQGYGDMYHYVAGHTPDVDNYPFSSFDYPSKIYRFIHIERIDGYLLTHLPLVARDIGGEAETGQPQAIDHNPYPSPMENNRKPTPISPYPPP